MESRISEILFIALAFILQIFICDYVSPSPYVCLSLMPLLVMLISRRVGIYGTMLIAFGLGILLDVLADGLVGLNAACAVLTAAFKEFNYKHIINSDRQDHTHIVSIRAAGIKKFLFYLLSLVAIYMACYVFLDCVGGSSAGFILFTFAASALASALLCFLVGFSYLKNS